MLQTFRSIVISVHPRIPTNIASINLWLWSLHVYFLENFPLFSRIVPITFNFNSDCSFENYSCWSTSPSCTSSCSGIHGTFKYCRKIYDLRSLDNVILPQYCLKGHIIVEDNCVGYFLLNEYYTHVIAKCMIHGDLTLTAHLHTAVLVTQNFSHILFSPDKVSYLSEVTNCLSFLRSCIENANSETHLQSAVKSL